MTQSLLRNKYRFVVLYEDCESGKVLTFAVTTTSAAVATARVIGYIDQERLHTGEEGYTLTPKRTKEETDYTIN